MPPTADYTKKAQKEYYQRIKTENSEQYEKTKQRARDFYHANKERIKLQKQLRDLKKKEEKAKNDTEEKPIEKVHKLTTEEIDDASEVLKQAGYNPMPTVYFNDKIKIKSKQLIF